MSGRQHLRRPQEDRGPVFEAPVPPIALGLDGRVDRGFDGAAVGLMGLGQHSLVTVRRNHVVGHSAANLAATDDGRDIRLAGAHRTQRCFE